MRRLLVAAFLCAVAACDHDELDFTLPDAGRDDHTDVDQSGSEACTGTGSCVAAAGSVAGPGRRGSQNVAAAAGSSGVDGAGGAGTGSAENSAGAGSATNPQRFQDGPNGYRGAPEQKAAWCDQGQTFEEICGNDIDEDCDGIVDEFAGIGRPCLSACGEGIYVCDVVTNSLLCGGCSIDLPERCGDGFVGPTEACDPAAPGERPGLTCTPTCERPLFIPCVDGGMAYPELCDELHVCNHRIGACMPVIGPRQRRCPDIPIEGGDAAEFYPMLEVQTEEEAWECWVTCTASEQCPTPLSDCYMGFCAVPF